MIGTLALAGGAGAQTMSLRQYTSLLANVQRDAVAASAPGPGMTEDTAAASAMKAIVPILRPAVRVNNQTLVSADNRIVLAQMQMAQTISDRNDQALHWRQIGDQIGSIRDSAQNLSASNTSGPVSAATAKAVSVLSGQEFASEPVPPKSIWDRFAAWLADVLRKFLHREPAVDPTYTPNVAIPEVILIVVIAIALGLIVYFAVQYFRNRSASDWARSAADSSLALTFEEKELVAAHDYVGLRELAAQAAEHGDFRSAFRLVFLAILVLLDAEGAIRLDRSKTNWEFLRSMSDQASLRDLLRPIVREFDRIWYGQREARTADYASAADSYGLIEALIGSWRSSAKDSNESGFAGAKVEHTKASVP